jgi:mannose-6-phosphate isomerase-like protein (cupin superfamily)
VQALFLLIGLPPLRRLHRQGTEDLRQSLPISFSVWCHYAAFNDIENDANHRSVNMDAKHVPGLKAFNEQKMQKVNVFETERMFCDIYCFEPGQEQKAHSHAGADKIYYVLEGNGTFHIGGESRDLQEQMAVIAPSEVEHGVVNTSNARLVLLVYMAPKP